MRRKPAAPQPAPARQLNCFVVTGFGEKTDYATGRVLNLDLTFETLVRPACDSVNVNAFRAIDANLSGSIDAVMYHWIYAADLVIADLSTLNANVFYELGVRHAQKPNTTVIIAESVLVQRIPFDLSSFVVHKYEHGGSSISAAEQSRFSQHLGGVLAKILAAEAERQRNAPDLPPATDSPVYQFLSGMTAPAYQPRSFMPPPAYLPPGQRRQTEAQPGASLASIIDAAEGAKTRKQFEPAITLFSQAMQAQVKGRSAPGKPAGKPDLFLAQRLALVTYKAGEVKLEGQIDKARALAALDAAQAILRQYCEPDLSTDPETLGLSGAIYKRRFDHGGALADLELAIRCYERGFYIKQDYYNGINVAFMYTRKANILSDRFAAIVAFGHANIIRRRVADICEALCADKAAFAARGDREWVYTSLAEAYHGLGETANQARVQADIDATASPFAQQSFGDQKAALQAEIDRFQQQFRPEELATTATATATATTTTTAARATPPDTSGRRRLSIDADVEPGRSVKSVELNCKIEYD